MNENSLKGCKQNVCNGREATKKLVYIYPILNVTQTGNALP